jgi:hypothetical protein
MTTMLVGDGEGMTYMPTNTAGISDHDASPTMDTKFYQEEDRSARRMKKLKLLLTVHPLTQQQQAWSWTTSGVGGLDDMLAHFCARQAWHRKDRTVAGRIGDAAGWDRDRNCTDIPGHTCQRWNSH